VSAPESGVSPQSPERPNEAEPFTPENRQRLLEWLRGWLHRVEARPVILGLLHAHDTEQTMRIAWTKRAEEAEAELAALRGALSSGTQPDSTIERDRLWCTALVVAGLTSDQIQAVTTAFIKIRPML
jgi:hypothetical protein